jgi:hypothetical protein
MEKFEAIKVDDKCIELKSSQELEKLYGLMEKDENFILQWKENADLKSEVKIATNISAKVKNGEIVLMSKEVRK